MTEEGDPFAPMNEEEDLYIDEESFDIGTEQALQDNLFTNENYSNESVNKVLRILAMVLEQV